MQKYSNKEKSSLQYHKTNKYANTFQAIFFLNKIHYLEAFPRLVFYFTTNETESAKGSKDREIKISNSANYSRLTYC